ncbi:hypothetical protein M2451_003195 [Dysgonomonas sp. PFB1-18]|nr:hypothetical protein [Dysgonomonas sp. PF1-14]MDH6340033.1 hypothetical protein [Dysgonomonas sp. PF1-16]MDH6381860.1 hypothetical protein [Dysgonomonas sp. PFB1-18]MDH6398898.1 hypothetical protein [Dysgonomonas sp. PF1-23]
MKNVTNAIKIPDTIIPVYDMYMLIIVDIQHIV